MEENIALELKDVSVAYGAEPTVQEKSGVGLDRGLGVWEVDPLAEH